MSECNRSCRHWPPSASDGKPCSQCDTSNEYMNCYERRAPGRPKKPDAMRQQYRVRLNDSQREQLKKLAATNGKTEAAMLRDLINKAFNKS